MRIMNGILERILRQRGVGREFLEPKYLSDGELPDVRVAAERLVRAVEKGEKIMIYGDYDADGVTASTVMYDTLGLLGAKEVEIMLPDRFIDGYGMSKRCVERAVERGISLVVTVDCGSNNGEVIAELGARGIDVVVTDHHELMGEMPKCVAVVNPHRKDFSGREDLRYLAGVGVAFMVARELVLMGKIPEGQEKWLLDLVLIGTICDSMVMKGINRELCYYGMVVLAKTRRVGLRELMRRAGVKELTSDAIGFQIGPRINAAGRMKSAEIALRLLMAKTGVLAASLAEELEVLNVERKTQQAAAVREVAEKGVGDESVIVASGKWHEGILGIIAGRLVEEYHRPAFALAETEPGMLKGSGRSFGDFSLAEACGDLIIGGGGHAAACGVKVATEMLDEFRVGISKYYDSLGLVGQKKYLLRNEDVELSEFSELDLELTEGLKKLEPYGQGNEEPVFLLSGAFVLDARKMGAEENHLRLTLRDARGKIFKVVAFYADRDWLELRGGEVVDAWVTLVENEWNGNKSVEGRLVRLEK